MAWWRIRGPMLLESFLPNIIVAITLKPTPPSAAIAQTTCHFFLLPQITE